MVEIKPQKSRNSYAEGPQYTPPVESFKDQYVNVMNQHADRPAVVSVQQRDDSLFTVGGKAPDAQGCIRYTFRELHQHATKLASALYAQGLGPQQSMATFLPNSAEFAIALLAATILNVSLVPLDPRSLTHPDEARHYLHMVKPSALIVSDEQCAERFDAIDGSSGFQNSLKILIVSGPVTKGGWSHLKDLLDETSEHNTINMLERGSGAENVDNDVALTIFTSGTSGLPKACPLTCKNVASFVNIPKSVRRMDPKERCLQQFLVSHIGAIGTMLQAWAAGACVVIPGPYFDAQASLHAIEHEKCTRMLAVPTIVDQLLSLPNFSRDKVQSLDHVTLGATMVSPEALKRCRDPTGFGAQAVIPGYGMTEALTLVTWEDNEDQIVEHGFASVGKPFRGVKIKICLPGSRESCAMGEIGELHISTPALTPGYVGAESEAFYYEGKSRWFATGDQARMHNSGALFILGRYKDAIIRGGENLSPAMIEYCINKQFPSMQVQVVGVNDAVAGEVPVAVVRAPGGLRPDVMQLQNFVRERLGMAAVPERFFTLSDLSLESFPSTTSGKVQKHELRKLVHSYFETTGQQYNQGQHVGSTFANTKGAMLETLGDLLGHESKDLWLEDRPLSTILDSLSMLKFASILKMKHEIDLSIADMTSSPTLEDLASRAKRNGTTSRPASAVPSKEGPPEDEDLPYEEESGRTRSLVEPSLGRLGLGWSIDVQQVYPVVGTSTWYWMKELPFQHKWTVATSLSSYDQVRRLVEISLSQWPIFRAIAVEYSKEVRLLVALRAQESYFNLAISHLSEVENTDALGNADLPITHLKGSLPEGLLFRVGIAKMGKIGTFSLLISADHIVYDDLSVQSWAEDLQRIIDGHAVIARTPFELFANAYYLYQDSLPAKSARDYHKQLLQQKGITLKTFWPAGDDLIASRPNMRRNSTEQSDGLRPKYGAGVRERTVHTPNMTKMRASQALSPVILAKIAIGLFNTRMSKQPYAIFTTLMAGRTWPFMSSSLAQHLPNPIDIAGPTMTSVADVLRIDQQEEIGQLYQRIEAEQQLSSRHQHVSPSMLSTLDVDSQRLKLQAMRQIFNWIPGRHGKEVSASRLLQPLGAPGGNNDPPPGVAWTCRLVDSETLSFRIRWNLELLPEEEVIVILDHVRSIFEWISDPDNWEKRIEEMETGAAVT